MPLDPDTAGTGLSSGRFIALPSNDLRQGEAEFSKVRKVVNILQQLHHTKAVGRSNQ